MVPVASPHCPLGLPSHLGLITRFALAALPRVLSFLGQKNWETPNVKNPQYLRKLVPDVFNQHIDPIRSPTLRISGSPGSLGPDHLRTATSGGGAIWSLAMSKDNSTLFCACDDGSLRNLSLEGGVGSLLDLLAGDALGMGMVEDRLW